MVVVTTFFMCFVVEFLAAATFAFMFFSHETTP